MHIRNNLHGFTLIELMIVVAIIAIIAAVALPSYNESVRKSKRSDAQSALVGLASAMERHFTENNTYTGATLGSGSGDIFSDQVPIDGGSKYYDLNIAAVTTTTFTVNASRTGSMAGDKCGDFTLNQIGVQGLANNTDTVAYCWRQ